MLSVTKCGFAVGKWTGEHRSRGVYNSAFSPCPAVQKQPTQLLLLQPVQGNLLV